MVKVIKGDLPGQRATGYHQYRGGFGKGEGFGVRRTLPTSKLQTIGDTKEQKRQKEDFKIASQLYSHWDIQQRDFFRRARKLDIKLDKQGRQVRRYLTRRQFAMQDIISKLNSPSSPYPAPLGFCICCVGEDQLPLTGYTLKITTNKLPKYTYEEETDNYGCFAPSSVSPLYEPYQLQCGAGILYDLTAEEIHKIRTISPYEYTGCGAKYDEVLTSTFQDEEFCTVDFKKVGIKPWESAVAKIHILAHLGGLHTNYYCNIYTTDWNISWGIDWAEPTKECNWTKTVHDGDVVRRSWKGEGDWGQGNLYIDEYSVKIRRP